MQKWIEADDSVTLAVLDRAADVIGSTMGPNGKSVTFCTEEGFTTNDGVQVMRRLKGWDDLSEQVLVRMRRASAATQRASGDGTSTTCVLMAAFFRDMVDRAYESPVTDAHLDTMLRWLRQSARKASRSRLRNVAKVAMHGHPWAKRIADLIWEIGPDGAFQAEISDQFFTRVESSFRWGAGVDASFHTGPNGVEANGAYVAVVSGEVKDLAEVGGVLNAYTQAYATEPAPLVIIAPVINGNALASLVQARHKDFGQMPIIVLKAPTKVEYADLEDLAAVCGTRVFDTVKGNSARSMAITPSQLGRAARFKATAVSASVVGSQAGSFVSHVEGLKALLADEKGEEMKEKLKLRLANLEGKFGVVGLPFTTDSEFLYMREVVEDAYRACQSALREGVLPGGGWSLACVASHVGLDNAAAAIPKILYGAGADDFVLQASTLGPAGIWPGPNDDVLDNAASVIAAVQNAWKEAKILFETEFFIVNE